MGLCRPDTDDKRSAYALYDYDVIIIHPKSYSHFIFGEDGPHSESINELYDLKRQDNRYDLDNAFHGHDRRNEMKAAIEQGANVIWCLADPKRSSFFGPRTTHVAYLSPLVSKIIEHGNLIYKKTRRFGKLDPNSPFQRYFISLEDKGWSIALEEVPEDVEIIAESPEGYCLGARIYNEKSRGWILTPPTSPDATNQLVLDAIGLAKDDATREKYHGLFLSHTFEDKPFVRQLKSDLEKHGVKNVWLDEAEINIGDSLLSKIAQGLKDCRYIAAVLSTKSVKAPWVQKELEIAMNREIAGGRVVVLPLLYEKCDLPPFLEGKLYADFTVPENYEDVLQKLLRRLSIN